MLQDRRRRRIAKMIIGGMGDSHSYENTEHKMDYDEEKEEAPKKQEMTPYQSLEMACGSMLAAIRADDVSLLCRSFKAAFKACEMEGY